MQNKSDKLNKCTHFGYLMPYSSYFCFHSIKFSQVLFAAFVGLLFCSNIYKTLIIIFLNAEIKS